MSELNHNKMVALDQVKQLEEDNALLLERVVYVEEKYARAIRLIKGLKSFINLLENENKEANATIQRLQNDLDSNLPLAPLYLEAQEQRLRLEKNFINSPYLIKILLIRLYMRLRWPKNLF